MAVNIDDNTTRWVLIEGVHILLDITEHQAGIDTVDGGKETRVGGICGPEEGAGWVLELEQSLDGIDLEGRGLDLDCIFGVSGGIGSVEG